MKKILALVLTAATMCSLLTGCGRPSESTGGTSGAASGGAVASGTAEYVLRLGHTVQSSSPAGKAYEAFEQYVEEKSNGRIDVQVYGDSTMGGDVQLTEALQLGTIEMAGIPTSVVSNFCPDFVALDLPFIYPDKETAYAALDGAFGDIFMSELDAVGIYGVSWMENGFRNFSANKPIRTVADMKGLKIRVMEAPAYLETMKALGANPTPMAFNELYTGLSQGTVDGQDNGINLTYTAKLYEVQKYYTLINYVYAPALSAASKTWWDSLPSDLQQIVTEGSNIMRDEVRRVNAETEVQYMEEMKAAGVEFIELTDEDREPFQEACAGVYDTMRQYMDNPEIIDTALAVADTYGK